MNPLKGAPARTFLGRIAGDSLEGGAHVSHNAVGVQNGHRIGDILHKRSEVTLSRIQSSLGGLALRRLAAEVAPAAEGEDAEPHAGEREQDENLIESKIFPADGPLGDQLQRIDERKDAEGDEHQGEKDDEIDNGATPQEIGHVPRHK